MEGTAALPLCAAVVRAILYLKLSLFYLLPVQTPFQESLSGRLLATHFFALKNFAKTVGVSEPMKPMA